MDCNYHPRPDDDCTASRIKKKTQVSTVSTIYPYFQLTSQGMSWFVQKRLFYPAVQWLTMFPKFYQKIGILGVSIHLTGRSRSPPLWLAQSLGAVCVRQMLGVFTHRFECVVLKPLKMSIVLQHVATKYEIRKTRSMLTCHFTLTHKYHASFPNSIGDPFTSFQSTAELYEIYRWLCFEVVYSIVFLLINIYI